MSVSAHTLRLAHSSGRVYKGCLRQRREDPVLSRCKRPLVRYTHTHFIAIQTHIHRHVRYCGGIPVSIRGKHPTELISTWGNTRRGIKPEFSKFTREILRTSNLSYGVIDGLTTGPLPLNRADTGRYRLRPYNTRDSEQERALLRCCRATTLARAGTTISKVGRDYPVPKRTGEFPNK